MLFPRYDVFLSYSRVDTERVQPLRDELRRLGYRVFFDVQSIDPGEKWKDRLDRAIRGSRTLVLCWSERTRGSDYITFEYSRAEAHHKPILPWLLDSTPLPAMLEIQGITNPDPIRVAAALAPALGWTLTLRRRLQLSIAVLITVAAAIAIWYATRPAPPWEFQGVIRDQNSRVVIANVEVDATLDQQSTTYKAQTDSQGNYDFHLPQPQPKYIHLVFSKDGYTGDEEKVPTNKPFDNYLNKIP
jgi:hypothetical protein